MGKWGNGRWEMGDKKDGRRKTSDRQYQELK